MFKRKCIYILMVFQIELSELNNLETDEFDQIDSMALTTSSKITAYHNPSQKRWLKYEDTSIADMLSKKVRVLCWVMTHPSNHEKKARHVKATWGKRCNKLLFMSSVHDKTLPSVKLPVKEGRKYLWGKTKAAFRYVYKHHRKDADWFLKADDDTYVIVENLRYMLADYDSQSLVHFGCRFKPYNRQGYMTGGAGYVLSRAALDLFLKKGLRAPRLCRYSGIGSEDIEIGKCLANLGVKLMDTRDTLKRGRFLPYAPQEHLFPKNNKNHKKSKMYRYSWYPANNGPDCCSDYAVSFHYVTPEQMYTLDYFIYHIRPYGIRFSGGDLPKILLKEKINTELVESH